MTSLYEKFSKSASRKFSSPLASQLCYIQLFKRELHIGTQFVSTFYGTLKPPVVSVFIYRDTDL